MQRSFIALLPLSNWYARIAIAISILCLAPLPQKVAGQEATKLDAFKFHAFDGFDKKPGLNWQPVRYDDSHISFTNVPGMLIITTQRGTIHRDERARGEVLAKNLFVMSNPLGKSTDFTMTTCIVGFRPEVAFQQAGLILYNDDDNYLKWGVQFDRRKGEGVSFSFMRESAGESKILHFAGLPAAKDHWLRLSKRGDLYEVAASADGKDYKVLGAEPWGDGAPKSFGIFAKNGGFEGIPEMPVAFEFFELASPVAAGAK
jgi:regulation of enolase protein 1 (concanavalin A-like superfamily)